MSNLYMSSELLRIDLGCGANKLSGFIGVDIYSDPNIDIVADLTQKFPFEDSEVDEIRAYDIIEHLPDRIHTMNEIWRVCKPGAKVNIRVPSTDGRGAFQDPTHISFWNINSFQYYCSKFSPYWNLCRTYGFAGDFNILRLEHEESPDNVIHVVVELYVVKPVLSGDKLDNTNKDIEFEQQVNNVIKENENLNFLLLPQPHFRRIGDANIHFERLKKSLECLHYYVFNNQDSKLWQEILSRFVKFTNFIPVYFNEENLKELYVRRAELIELYLKLNGHKIDHEFTDEFLNRKKIRLGILASHFTPSAETFASLPVYEYLSREFEVILYSLTKTSHPLEQYCQVCANSFKLLPQDLTTQVNTIRADDLDILFVATNVTAVTNQVCLLVIHRLARIQVTSGGSVVTTGMRNIDFFISGKLNSPSPTAQDQYQEKLVKIDGTAQCFSYGTEEKRIITSLERNKLGIPKDAVVFVSSANYFKIVPELIEIWTKVLTKVPNSVLMLLPFGPNWSSSYPKEEFTNYLQSIFIQHGLSHKQLIVLDPQPVPDRETMVEYYKISDIYLDSFPFAGTTSLVEPLIAHLPVITMQGNCFRSAMGAAMIKALNVSDLVAFDEESYINLATKLGVNSNLRRQKSEQIRTAMQDNPCFLDSHSYSAQLDTLFQELYYQYISNSLQKNFHLRDINLIVFPDWQKEENILVSELMSLIPKLVEHTQASKITLLIEACGASEKADLMVSSILMNYFISKNIEEDDIYDPGIEISIIDQLNAIQWKALIHRLTAKVNLYYENKILLNKCLFKQINELDSIESFTNVLKYKGSNY